MNCFRYFGFKSLSEVDRLTIPEYELLVEAYRLKLVDQERMVHWQAFLNFAVQAKRPVGKRKEKPVYSSFDKFFDYEKELKKAGTKKKENRSRFSGIGKLLRKEGT